MKHKILSALFALTFVVSSFAALEQKPDDPYFEKFNPTKAPKPSHLLLKKDDRLAICGDSITEQKMYSRMMETYITVALPELNVSTRQYGWSGERAPGFLARMTNDVLRFHPNVVTTCYGMNDHSYQPYNDSIGETYRTNQDAIVRACKAANVRTIIVGSPGCMGPKAAWGFIKGTAEERNLNLCNLRNIDIDIANKEHVGFADVFWPMFTAEYFAREKFGETYALAGGDSVHPDWAGQTVMAYAFLKALGCQGDIGTITVDLKNGKAKATKGHEITSSVDGKVTVTSSRYPFCATGPTNVHSSIRSGMTVVPFNQDLNRFILIAKHTTAPKYKVTWGEESRTYTADQLKKGINLADDFQINPFSAQFKAVDDAVAAKQNFETKQIKELFHGKSGKDDMDATVKKTESERAPLVAAIHAAFKPVTHTITITAE
jgi:lysophospholipase L1-like esterase